MTVQLDQQYEVSVQDSDVLHRSADLCFNRWGNRTGRPRSKTWLDRSYKSYFEQLL